MRLIQANNVDSDESSIQQQEGSPELVALQVEVLASEVVDLMRDFIDSLRQDFSPGTSPSSSATAATATARAANVQKQRVVVSPSSCCVTVTRQTQARINTVCRKVSLATTATVVVGEESSSSSSASSSSPKEVVNANDSSSNGKHEEDRESPEEAAGAVAVSRQHVVFKILLPLLKALFQCYSILDRLPPPPPPVSSSSSSRPSDTTKPPPPIGMLSLRNYTDIAALVEFTVCTSILPLLQGDDNTILPSVQVRARHLLPRTLQGRLVRQSLLWGKLQQEQQQQERQRPEQQHQEKQPRQQEELHGAHVVAQAAAAAAYGDDESTTTTKANSTRQEYDELWETAMTIGNLICLDRFRPMLLPRHLADIYAAIFQSEALLQLQAQQQPQQRLLQRLQRSQQQDNDSNNIDGDGGGLRGGSSGGGDPDEVAAPPQPLKCYRHQDDMQLLVTLGLVSPADVENYHCSQSFGGDAAAPIGTSTIRANLVAQQQQQQQQPVVAVVEAHLQARAFQSLLLQGCKGPLWLRQRIGPLLNALATRNLLALLDVYIGGNSSSGSGTTDPSAASLRLAKALLTAVGHTTAAPQQSLSHENEKNNDYLSKLVGQLIHVLDQAMENSTTPSSSSSFAGNLALSHVDCVNTHFVWAVLDQLPDDIMATCVLEQLVTGPIFASLRHPEHVTNSNTTGPATTVDAPTVAIHRAIRRLGLLLSNFPTSCTPVALSRFCRLVLLAPLVIPATSRDATNHHDVTINVTLFGLLVSLASGTSSKQVVVVDPAATSSTLQEDTVWALRCIIETVVAAKFHSPGNKSTCQQVAPGVDVMAVVLVHAVVPSLDWDMAGHRFVDSSASASTLVKGNGTFTGICIEKEDPWYTDISRIASEMERRATVVVKDLLVPLLPKVDHDGTDATNSGMREGSELPARLLQLLLVMYHSTISNAKRRAVFRHELFQMVPLVLLPVLCEHCSVEALLVRGSGQDSALFDTMRIVFDGIAQGTAAVARNSSNGMGNDGGFASAHEVFSSILSMPNINIAEESEASERELISDDKELTWSIASVLLSLLIGILELGATTRSMGEETGLISLIPSLTAMASTSSSRPEEPSTCPAEVAEMASHALALIASRKALSKEGEEEQPPPASGNSFVDKLLQAERDLNSVEPPLRARGVVTLRHLACGLGGTHGSIRMSIPTDSHTANDDDDELLQNLIVLSIAALADAESYVYLAAVQTIAVIADQRPSRTLPLVLRAVATGTIEGSEASLSNEQRIKLAESLISMIRRRAAIYEYLPLIMNVLAFGSIVSTLNIPESNARTIQVVTHEYFLKGPTVSNDDDDEEDPKEKYIRLNTGGPIFDSEEVDVVRSTVINIVAEVVSVAHPSVLALYCSVLVDCATRSLQLDASRPVRRAGAFLALQLYTALVREVDEARVSFAAMKSSPCPMAVSIGYAEEDTLGAVLQRCISGADVGDWTNEKGRLFDSATVARCEEALTRRKELEQDGIFTAARLIGPSNAREDAITRLLGEGKGEHGASPLNDVRSSMIEEL